MSEKSYVGMAQCFYCGEPKDVVVLDRRLKNSLDRLACYDKEPCDKCKDLMKQGVMLIAVKDGETGENPYRTGKIVVLKEEAIRRICTPDFVESVCKSRVAFIEESVLEQLVPEETEDGKTGDC